MSERRPSVFISYSHEDEPWKDRLVQHLAVLAEEQGFEVWDDRRIGAGKDWKAEIEQALLSASVAVLLVSVDFLTSRFVKGQEVPLLLKRRGEERLPVIPVIVGPCAWKRVGWLAGIQARPKDGRALSGMSLPAADQALAQVAAEIADMLAQVSRRISPDATPKHSGRLRADASTAESRKLVPGAMRGLFTGRLPSRSQRTVAAVGRGRLTWLIALAVVAMAAYLVPRRFMKEPTPTPSPSVHSPSPPESTPVSTLLPAVPTSLTSSPSPSSSLQAPSSPESTPVTTALPLVPTSVASSPSPSSSLQAPSSPESTPASTALPLVPPGVVSRPFSFETVTVNDRGEVVTRDKVTASSFAEDLGGGVSLEMVAVPGGSFMMGSPVTEAGREPYEGPQHQVTVAPFWMGKLEVTQAQWRAVASSLPRVQHDLAPAPSHFKGDQLPVEQVSWHDAVEFCARLARHTGRQYRLPSEAEWEYAARAGTTTPFHFGETITVELARYNGNYPYGRGPKGNYRQETTPVGSFGVGNAFGLFDVHGNVWEWVEDVWHDGYSGAPSDGRAWNKAGDARRVLRGGSWFNNARYCRSAYRNWFPPEHTNLNWGFRVVCSVSRTR